MSFMTVSQVSLRAPGSDTRPLPLQAFGQPQHQQTPRNS